MDAHSDTKRHRANAWFDTALSSRLGDPRSGAIVVIMQRLHEQDLSGHLLGKGGWEHLCLPTYFEKARAFRTCLADIPKYAQWGTDPRQEEGELLFPKLFNEAVVKEAERDLQELAFAGQHQQRPAPRTGTIFKADMLMQSDGQFWPWPHSEKIIEAYMSWDTAVKSASQNDMTAGCVVFRCSDGFVYLYPVVLDRMEIPKVIKTVALEWARWRVKLGMPLAAARIEEGAAGTPAVQGARQLMTQHRENPTTRDFQLDALARQKDHSARSPEEQRAMSIVRASYPPNDDWTPEEWDTVRHAPPLVMNPYACGGSGDILTRVQPILPFVMGRNVRLCADAHNLLVARAWLQELLALPTSKHDDAVQSTIGAVLPFVGAPAYKHGEEPCITEEMLRRCQRRGI
jgi:phage terminase large subunit-like protein